MKVLVSAYACEPHKGSEPGVGWHWSKQIARFSEVWVLTRENNRESIENELSRNPDRNLHFHYVDLPRWVSFWKKGQKGIYLYYCLWQLWAYLEARRLHKSIQLNVVHHVTFGNVWMPTLMPLLNIPFIWGPVGGAELIPQKLRKHFTLRWRLYERIRDFLIFWTFKINPLSRITMKKSALIISRTKVTTDAFSNEYQKKISTMLETGIDDTFLNGFKFDNHEETGLTILMVGRLLHWKGFDIGIEAFTKIAEVFSEAKLIIIGTGPEKNNLERISNEFSEKNRIIFAGELPREKVMKYMVESDIFLLPSMKDAGTWVLFEAIAAGLAIVCLDYAGPAEIVDNSCAIMIPVGPRNEILCGFTEALTRLLSSKTLRKQMGILAKRRLQNLFLWENKGLEIQKFYKNILFKEKDRIM